SAGELRDRAAPRTRLDGRRRTAAGADRRRGRERLLRRDRRPDPRGTPDAGPRARDPRSGARPGRVVEPWLVPELSIAPPPLLVLWGNRPGEKAGWPLPGRSS